MKKYTIITRRKGTRRVYGDGYVYSDLEYAKQTAEKNYMTGEYASVKVIEHGGSRILAQYPEAKQ